MFQMIYDDMHQIKCEVDETMDMIRDMYSKLLHRALCSLKEIKESKCCNIYSFMKQKFYSTIMMEYPFMKQLKFIVH